MDRQKQTVLSYDFIRLIAVFLVVLGHSTYLTVTTDYGAIDWSLPSDASSLYQAAFFKIWRYLSAWVYRCHIPLFFMLAGSAYALSEAKNFKELIVKKAKRLLIPFFLCGLFFAIPLKTAGHFYDFSKTAEIYAAFLSGRECGHLWFLPALFWCFLIFFALKKTFRNNAFVFVMSFLLYLYHDAAKFNFFEFSFSSQYVWFFAGGYWFESVRTKLEERKKMLLSLTAIFLAINILDTENHFLRPMFYIYAGCGLFYLIGMTLAAFFKTARANVCFKKLVRSSYGIYLFHDPLTVLFLFWMMRSNILSTGAGVVLYFLIRTAGVIICSIALDDLTIRVKRVKPIIHILQRKFLH